MKNIEKAILYVIVFTVSLAIGGWLCRYTHLYKNKPVTLDKVKHQIRDTRLPVDKRLGIFCSLIPYPNYPGYYSPLSENENYVYPEVGSPRCPMNSYRQCTNNVYSQAVNPKDNEDFFDRTQIPVGSNNKCQYGSTYSTCYPLRHKTELGEIHASYCKIKNQENKGSVSDFSRVNIYNKSDDVSRQDD